MKKGTNDQYFTSTLTKRLLLGWLVGILLIGGLIVNAEAGLWGDDESADPGDQPLTLNTFRNVAQMEMQIVVNISSTQVIKNPYSSRRQPPGRDFDPFREFFGDQFDFFFGFPHGRQEEYETQSLGSGVIIDKDGYILTNNHVVENATEIMVKLQNGEEYKATVKGRDPRTDLALVKIDADEELKVAQLGNSEKLKIGDWVIAIGNPFGFDFTMTVGVVSAKGRILGAGPYDDFIQTDASINPGNSGGPLLDVTGKVVGINTAIFSRTGSYAGIGFAIPINLAKEIYPQLLEHGKVTRAWLGVEINKVDSDLAETLGLSEPIGAMVTEVMNNSPAAQAGLELGDVIVKFNDQKIEEFHQLPTIVAHASVGKKVDVVVMRNGKKKTFTITLQEMPEDFGVAQEPSTSKSEKIGMRVQELDNTIRKQYNIDSDIEGVVITRINPGSPAAEADLREGDVIMKVNRTSIDDLKEFKDAINDAKEGDVILMRVLREGRLLLRTVKLK